MRFKLKFKLVLVEPRHSPLPSQGLALAIEWQVGELGYFFLSL